MRLAEFSNFFYSKDASTPNQCGAYIRLDKKLEMDFGDGGTGGSPAGITTRIRVTSTSTINDSDWHHFAGTIEHGSPTTAKLYIDGVLDKTDTSKTQTGQPAISEMWIGDYHAAGTNEHNGPLACLRFYHNPLSENEIKQIYNSDLRLIKGLENE